MRSPDDKQIDKQIAQNVLSRAKRRDAPALRTMFQQFCGPHDEILAADYLGLRGLWHVGMHSFICLTKSRICAIEVGWLGRVIYSEGYLEEYNSGHITQPSLIPLYLICALVFLATFGIGIILFPFIIRLYYRFFKSGALLNFREGIPIHIFCNRRDLNRLNHCWRLVVSARDERISFLRKVPESDLETSEEMKAESSDAE